MMISPDQLSPVRLDYGTGRAGRGLRRHTGTGPADRVIIMINAWTESASPGRLEPALTNPS